MKVQIRQAHPNDARNVAQVHFSSVHGIGFKFYSADVCNEWSPPTTVERIKQFSDAISLGDELMFVAETNGEIAGFASIFPKNFELRAVYVDPKFTGIGIGKKLLLKVERVARDLGIKQLTMHASLSAEAFYRSQGYIESDRVDHILSSGKKMSAVKMEKVLG